MNASQFISIVVAGALLCMGGLGISITEWNHSTTAQKQALISQSRLDQDQKTILLRLVSASEWAELRQTLSDIRAEFRIKANFTRNASAKAAFSEAERNLRDLLTVTEDLELQQKILTAARKKLANDANSSDPNTLSRDETVINKVLQDIEIKQKELPNIAQGYLVAVLTQTAKANAILTDELNNRSAGYLWGIATAIGGVIMSGGAAIKLFLEVSKLKLECARLRNQTSA